MFSTKKTKEGANGYCTENGNKTDVRCEWGKALQTLKAFRAIRQLTFPITGLIRTGSFDIPFLLENGNYIVHRCLSEITGHHKLRFCDIRIVPYLGEHPGLGIVESFITHFITHLVDEVEWDGDCNVVVGEIKCPFAVLGRDHGDSLFSHLYVVVIRREAAVTEQPAFTYGVPFLQKGSMSAIECHY